MAGPRRTDLHQIAPGPSAPGTDAPPQPEIPHAELLRRLCSSDRREQRGACAHALPRLDKDRELRDAVRELARQGSRQTRFVAAWLLFRAETPSLRLLPPLLDALELADGDLRWEAAQMLASLGRVHGEVYSVLLHEARGHSSPLRRRMALYALRELGPERAQTEQAFLDALLDSSLEVRRAAFSSSPKLHELGDAWLERALEILEHDLDAGMRALAPLVLARIAELNAAERPRIAELLQALRSAADPGVARAAVLAERRLAASGR